jgi:hypothetical protein
MTTLTDDHESDDADRWYDEQLAQRSEAKALKMTKDQIADKLRDYAETLQFLGEAEDHQELIEMVGEMERLADTISMKVERGTY